MFPVPAPTEKWESDPVRDQTPPVGALPQPAETARAKSSTASEPGGGGTVAVTVLVVVLVAPALSVTVRPIV